MAEWKTINDNKFAEELLNTASILQVLLKQYFEFETNKIINMAENLKKLDKNSLNSKKENY